MEEVDLFTVNVFQTSANQEQDANGVGQEGGNKTIGEYQNMVSARVIKGRMLELEHSNLAGPEVKFKTVINYERTLEPNAFIGISFKPQDGYITKPDDW